MKLSPARRIAFEILRRAELESAYAADLLHARLEGAKREDAALATELTMGVLRWQRLLDFLLKRQLSKPVEALDLEVLLALRIGIYQLRFLTRVPAHAAVSESVELTRFARKSSAAGLVNAVLRRATTSARESVESMLPSAWEPAERLAIAHSHPTWLVQRWVGRWGETQTARLLEANNRPPRLACAVHKPAQIEDIQTALEDAGLKVEPGHWLTSALAVRGGDPFTSEPFRRGQISIQDEASQMVALLLEVRAGQGVLDLCAAPGGKTALLAQAAGPTSLVVAADRHAHRLRAMRQNLERVGGRGVRVVALDATGPLPFDCLFDRILLDAPCSGTGTLARNPEIRWRLRAEDLADLHYRQVKLLASALDQLAPEGRLVYSTCSIELEENQEVVANALAGRRGFRRVSGLDALRPHLRRGVLPEALFSADGCFQTLPSVHNTDGFFAVVLEREEPKPAPR